MPVSSPLQARFEIVRRVRPVELVSTSSTTGGPRPTTGVSAPYVAVEADLTGPGTAELALVSGDTRLTGFRDDRGLGLRVRTGDRVTVHRSRRHGRPGPPVDGLALTLTSSHLVVHSREHDRWWVRGRVDLVDRVDVHAEAWLAGVSIEASGSAEVARSGPFGQVGLRDLRVVTHADGTAYRDGDRLLFTATSAGPGSFRSGHASVWALDAESLDLEHRGDVYLRRPGGEGVGVYGDHAGHLVRDGERWLFAASTWGDFDRAPKGARVDCVLAESAADLTLGEHVLDARPLPLPTGGERSVGVWDPHLVRTGDADWLVAFVSATRYFRFHPMVAEGPDLDSLTLRASASDRRATEGSTLWRDAGGWRVLASDGRDGHRGRRERYPVFDLDLRQVGRLDAAYPTNIPWPTLVEHERAPLLVGFNGRPYGGPLVGYGSHGDVVIQRGR